MKDHIKSIQQVLIFLSSALIVTFSGGCRHQPAKGYILLNPGFSCDIEIPFLVLDSIKLLPRKIEYSLTDTFRVADWDFYNEVSFFFWKNNCLNPRKNNNLDSIVFIFRHDNRVLRSGASIRELEYFSNMRSSVRVYDDFISQNFLRPKFRSDIIALSHFYGKALAPNPKEGLIYYENFLLFLLEFGISCENGVPSEEDIRILKYVLEGISEGDYGEISQSLTKFLDKCGVENI
ncbi:MAG: hypothetical protein R3D00_21415 [Bacteroidia bacterium]